METVKTYMVRKPSDIEEVRNLTQQYAHQAEATSGNYDHLLATCMKWFEVE